MADIDLKTETPDTTLPSTGFLFGADSQAAVSPSVYSTQTVATALLGSTSLTGATITTSQPVVDMAQTWNAGAVTFTGLRFNATDTASASASLLMDLQRGGVSQFSVRRDGYVVAASALFSSGANGIGLNYTTGSCLFGSAIRLEWGSAGINSPDLFLTRRGAANLRFGNVDAAAPVAQTLSVQSVVAGTSNTAGANLTITGSQSTGTGTGGSIIFQVAPAGSAGTAQNALVNVLTIAPTGVVTIDNASLSLGANRQIRFATTPITYIAPRSSTANDINFGLDAASPLAVTIGAPGGRTSTDTNTAGANFILRGGLGTGSANGGNLQFAVSLPGASGSTSNAATNIAYFAGASGHMLWNTDNTYDIGASGATRPRNFFLGAYQEMTEMTAPAAPAANSVRIYAVDNGSGKTQLMALFATGAAQQIAIEP